MNVKLLSLLVIIILFFSTTFAGVHIIPNLPKLIVKDGVSLLVAPVHFSKVDWLYIGIGTSVTLSSMSMDRWARDEIERGKPIRAPFIIRSGDFISSPYMLFGLPLGLYLLGEVSDNDKIRLTGIEGVEAVMLSIGSAYLLKFMTGRERPLHSDSPFHFCGPHTFSDEHLSMPSTHTTAFSALATVIAERVHFPPLTDLVFISIGAAGASRVWHSEHWVSDAVLGGLVGYAIGRFIVRRHKEDEDEKNRNKNYIEF